MIHRCSLLKEIMDNEVDERIKQERQKDAAKVQQRRRKRNKTLENRGTDYGDAGRNPNNDEDEIPDPNAHGTGFSDGEQTHYSMEIGKANQESDLDSDSTDEVSV